MPVRLRNNAIPVVINNGGAPSYAIDALLRRDGRLVLPESGFTMAATDVAYALPDSEWQLTQDAHKLFDRVFEHHGTDYLQNMLDLSARIDRDAPTSVDVPEIVNILGISWADTSGWKARRYAAALENLSTQRSMEALDQLAPEHNPDKVREYVAMEYLNQYHRFVPGYLHIDNVVEEDHDTVVAALMAWRASGGRLGKSACDFIEPPPLTISLENAPNDHPSVMFDWPMVNERSKRLAGSDLNHFLTPMESALLAGMSYLGNRDSAVATQMANKIEQLMGRQFTGGYSAPSITEEALERYHRDCLTRCFALEDQYTRAKESTTEERVTIYTSPFRLKSLYVPASKKDEFTGQLSDLSYEIGVLKGAKTYMQQRNNCATPERWIALEIDRVTSSFATEPAKTLQHMVEQACSCLEDGYAGAIRDLEGNEKGAIYSGGGMQHTFHEAWRLHCRDNGRTKILIDMGHPIWDGDATERTHELCNCLTDHVPRILEGIEKGWPLVSIMQRGYPVGIAFHNALPRQQLEPVIKPDNEDGLSL